MSVQRIALLSIILFTANEPAMAQATDSDTAPPFAPPWVVQSGNFLMLTFDLKVADVRKLLPKGVEPLVNEAGEVVAILEMYETERVSGIPQYKTAFIVVEVQGHDSREGTPGHFAVWGRVSPREALDAFRNHFGFPYQDAPDIDFSMEEKAHVANTGGPGREALRVKIAPIPEQPFEGEGSVNLVGMNADSGTVKSEVPYIMRGYNGKLLSFELRPGSDPVLKLLRNAVPLQAWVSNDRILSYSHAVFSD